MDITEEAVKHVYDLARDVYNGKLTKAQAVETSVENGFQGAQRQLEHTLEHQRGLDGAIAVVEASPPTA